MLNLTKTKSGYEAHFNNGRLIGQFEPLEDGFYYFWPQFEGGGCLTPFILREIADELDKLNQPWNDEIDKYFSGREIREQI